MDDLMPVPWLPYLVTDYIRRLQPVTVFEWGSGGSTLFFAAMGARLVSVEHDRGWWDKVHRALPERYQEEHHLVPWEEGEIGPDKANPAHYKSGSTELGEVNFKRYASFIDSYGDFDLILIDGMARASCLVHAIPHVKPGGCIVLDNVNDRPYYLEQTGHLFGNWEDGWERVEVMGYGPILAYQWSTLILKNTRRDNYANIN